MSKISRHTYAGNRLEFLFPLKQIFPVKWRCICSGDSSWISDIDWLFRYCLYLLAVIFSNNFILNIELSILFKIFLEDTEENSLFPKIKFIFFTSVRVIINKEEIYSFSGDNLILQSARFPTIYRLQDLNYNIPIL